MAFGSICRSERCLTSLPNYKLLKTALVRGILLFFFFYFYDFFWFKTVHCPRLLLLPRRIRVVSYELSLQKSDHHRRLLIMIIFCVIIFCVKCEDWKVNCGSDRISILFDPQFLESQTGSSNHKLCKFV